MTLHIFIFSSLSVTAMHFWQRQWFPVSLSTVWNSVCFPGFLLTFLRLVAIQSNGLRAQSAVIHIKLVEETDFFKLISKMVSAKVNATLVRNLSSGLQFQLPR